MSAKATLVRALNTSRPPNSAAVPRALKRLFPDVMAVVDATEGVQVSVTPRDCGLGAKPGDPSGCAMARALQRQHHADNAVIGMTRSYVIVGDVALRFTTPPSVAREVTSFDRNADFAPGEYKLSPMPPSQRLGSRGTGGGGSGSHTVHRIVHTSTVRVRTLPS